MNVRHRIRSKHSQTRKEHNRVRKEPSRIRRRCQRVCWIGSGQWTCFVCGWLLRITPTTFRWVCSNYSKYFAFRRLLTRQVQESYQKLRNTNRYLLSNLFDFDRTRDSVPYSQLSLFDKWCLSRLFSLSTKVTQAYDHFIFTDVYFHVSTFVMQISIAGFVRHFGPFSHLF